MPCHDGWGPAAEAPGRLRRCGYAQSRRAARRRLWLDRVVDYRNAIGHRDETKVADFEDRGEIKATKGSYQQHRRALDALAGTTDDVVAEQIAHTPGIRKPW